MSLPSVSIIIPSYNSAAFLAATITSALAQCYGSCEILIVDDGSTDDTPAICQPFKNQIHYHRQLNAGVSAARNHGAALARGEWLLFLDSDDRLLPTAIDTLVKTGMQQAAGVVYGMVIERTQPPHQPRLNGFDYCIGNPPQPALKNYGRSAVITPGSALLRADIHQQVGGFVPTYEPMEDRDYWIKCGFLTPFAFSDTVVLDKTWRLASAGRQHAKRIWNGLRSRLALPFWCQEHHIPCMGFPTDRKTLIEKALKEAIWYKAIDILDPLLHEAKQCHASLFWQWRAQIMRRLLCRQSIHLPTWWIPL